MEPWERDWVAVGMAWVGLRRWMYGHDDGEQAWLWLQEQMQARFSPAPSSGCCRPPGRHITPDMTALLAAVAADLGLVSGQECPNSA